ncbi:unnamed protein product [Sphagnum balticum]
MNIASAWSCRRNGQTLFYARKQNKSSRSPTHLSCLDGFRSLAVLWVFAINSYQTMIIALSVSDTDKASYNDMLHSVAMRPVMNGALAVDVFFIVSGILIVNTLTRDLATIRHKTNTANAFTEPLVLNDRISSARDDNTSSTQNNSVTVNSAIRNFFIRRYLRLMPAYALAILLGILTSITSSSSPSSSAVNPCSSNAWRNLLFIQNFFPRNDMCLDWSWSIALQWQMYLISPLIVLAALKWPQHAYTMIATITVVSLALYMSLTAVDVSDGAASYFASVPVAFLPFTRFFAYSFGMAIAVAIDRYKKELADTDNSLASADDVIETLSCQQH